MKDQPGQAGYLADGTRPLVAANAVRRHFRGRSESRSRPGWSKARFDPSCYNGELGLRGSPVTGLLEQGSYE
jgi:hypothetical protein